jgi:hypothetical protein
VPRKPRLDIPGAVHRVSARAVWERTLFRDEDDRVLFERLLGRIAERHGWRCHGCVLADTSYELLVETSGAPLSDGMRELNGRYATYVNDRDGSSGHVFGDRYRSEVIAGPTN